MMTNLTSKYAHRERCQECNKQLLIGQSAIECSSCEKILHKKCTKENFIVFRGENYCSMCIQSQNIIRYNPYYDTYGGNDSEKYYDDDPMNYINELQYISDLLENCKQFSPSEIPTHDETFSTYFTNIDGNSSNFDELLVNLKSINNSFSVIGLAETNTSPCSKDVFVLPGYTSCYQECSPGKHKGTGVALYVNNSFNFTELQST